MSAEDDFPWDEDYAYIRWVEMCDVIDTLRTEKASLLTAMKGLTGTIQGQWGNIDGLARQLADLQGVHAALLDSYDVLISGSYQ